MASRDGEDGEVGYRRGRWWSGLYIERADGEVGYGRGRLSEADIIRRSLKDVGVLRARMEPERNTAPVERRLWSTRNQIISSERPDSSSERSTAPEIDPEEGRVNQIRHGVSRLHLDREEDVAGSAHEDCGFFLKQ